MKSIKKSFISMMAGISIIGCFSCSNNELKIAKLDQTPYANEEELNQISEMSNDYVNYKVARSLAMLELADFENVSGWSTNSVLSEKPVIIWKNSVEPEYYEYHVFDNDEEVGYITCNINKKSGDPVAYIGSDVKKYYSNDSRSLIAENSKIYAADYPSVTIISDSRDIETDSEISEEELYEEWLNSLTEDDFESLGTTKEDALANHVEQIKENESRLETLWSLIDEQESNLLNLTDEEIINAISNNEENSSRSYLVTDSTSTSNYKEDCVFVEPYSSNEGNRKFIYCVPSVIEFICQTYCSDNNINLTNDEIFNAINKAMGDQGQYSLFGDYKYKQALNDGTSGHLTESFSLFHNFDWITSDLKKNQLPVISERSGGSNFWGLFKEGHCRLVTGTFKKQNAVQRSFLWIKWTDWEKTGYYYMWDNGHDKNNSPISNDVSYSIYKNNANNHFWEKDGTWYYTDTKTIKNK